MDNKLESIRFVLVLALTQGYHLRKGSEPISQDSMAFAINQMDKAKLSFKTQNNALQYFNEIDNQKIWESMFKISLDKLALNILNN